MWRWCTVLLMAFAFNASAQTLSWFFLAEGVQRPEDLDDYQRAGMNVLWVEIPYRPDSDFSDYDQLLDEADKRNLPYIIALDLRPPAAMRQSMRCSPFDNAYLTWLRLWLNTVIPHFRNRAKLLGYALGREVDEAISYDDEGFASFLQSQYQTLENLSKFWRIPVNSWQIPQVIAMHLDDENSPLSYGRPSFDVALYRWTTLQNLLSLWAREVRIRDPNPQHLLFAGPLKTYRSLAVVTLDYQGVIPYISPERAEVDWQGHNCHAVAIARRGGRFIVIPMLTTKLKEGQIIAPEGLIRWTMASIAMGAKGAIFKSWETIEAKPIVRDNITALVKRIQYEIPPDAIPNTRTAILYTPFGEGVMDSQGFPLYGFAIANDIQANPIRLSFDEPASLFFSLRFNPYGTVDSITPFELTPEILSRYKVLFAPVAAYLEPAMQANLAKFVANGGIVVADLGIAAFQANTPFQTFPPTIMDLFGLTGMAGFVAGPSVRANMVVVNPHSLFANMPRGFNFGKPKGAFGPVLGFVPTTKAHFWASLALTGTIGGFKKQGREGRTFPITGRAGVLINNYKRGFAIFASTFLWTLWSPMDFGFDLFHGSLLERSSPLRLVTNSFMPPIWVSETNKGILVINPTSFHQQVRLVWQTPIFYAITNAFVRPIRMRPLMQEIVLNLRPHDWMFLKPIADLNPPVEVIAESQNANEFKLRLGTSPARTVTIGFWLPSEIKRLLVKIERNGETREHEIAPDRWGKFTIENVPTPSTLIASPLQK